MLQRVLQAARRLIAIAITITAVAPPAIAQGRDITVMMQKSSTTVPVTLVTLCDIQVTRPNAASDLNQTTACIGPGLGDVSAFASGLVSRSGLSRASMKLGFNGFRMSRAERLSAYTTSGYTDLLRTMVVGGASPPTTAVLLVSLEGHLSAQSSPDYFCDPNKLICRQSGVGLMTTNSVFVGYHEPVSGATDGAMRSVTGVLMLGDRLYIDNSAVTASGSVSPTFRDCFGDCVNTANYKGNLTIRVPLRPDGTLPMRMWLATSVYFEWSGVRIPTDSATIWGSYESSSLGMHVQSVKFLDATGKDVTAQTAVLYSSGQRYGAAAAPAVNFSELLAQFMGTGTVPPLSLAYLDLGGNKNGRLDVGDLAAWLAANPQPAAAATSLVNAAAAHRP